MTLSGEILQPLRLTAHSSEGEVQEGFEFALGRWILMKKMYSARMPFRGRHRTALTITRALLSVLPHLEALSAEALSQPGILPKLGKGRAGLAGFLVSTAGIEETWAGLGVILGTSLDRIVKFYAGSLCLHRWPSLHLA